MMRRSSSSSHIPLLSKTSASRRSRSLNRFSSRETIIKNDPPNARNSIKATPLRKIGSSAQSSSALLRNSREPSLSRISTKVTPVNKVGLKLPSSASSSKAKVSPGSCFRETKTIQHLASSKKWVAEQFVKVQDFIDNSGYFDNMVVTSKNIKPPSIKAFVYTSKVLLEQFLGNINMDQNNYKEVIAEKLKVLQYPGTVPKSVLKTVNTMHSWSQVIGMWAWLIDKLKSATQRDEKSFSCLDPSEKELQLKMEVCREFILERYFLFNNSNDQDEIDKINDLYIRKFSEICGFSQEEYLNIEDEIQEAKEYKNKQEEDLKVLENKIRERKSRIEQMEREIQEFEAADAAKEHDLREKIRILQAKKIDIVAKREELQSKNYALRAAIKDQPCTYEIKKKILGDINELKRTIDAKKERLEFLQKIHSKYVGKLEEEITKIYTLVKEWNDKIIPFSVEEPRIKDLLFPETSFQTKEFLDKIKEINQKMIKIDAQIVQEADSVDRDISRLNDKIAEEESEVECLGKKLSQLKHNIKDLGERIIALREEKKQQRHKWEEEKELLLNEHRRLHHFNTTELKEMENNLLALQNKVDIDKNELSKLGEKSIALFVEIHKKVRDSYVFINGILSTSMDKLKKRKVLEIAQQRDMLMACEKFGELRKELGRYN